MRRVGDRDDLEAGGRGLVERDVGEVRGHRRRVALEGQPGARQPRRRDRAGVSNGATHHTKPVSPRRVRVADLGDPPVGVVRLEARADDDVAERVGDRRDRPRDVRVEVRLDGISGSMIRAATWSATIASISPASDMSVRGGGDRRHASVAAAAERAPGRGAGVLAVRRRRACR